MARIKNPIQKEKKVEELKLFTRLITTYKATPCWTILYNKQNISFPGNSLIEKGYQNYLLNLNLDNKQKPKNKCVVHDYTIDFTSMKAKHIIENGIYDLKRIIKEEFIHKLDPTHKDILPSCFLKKEEKEKEEDCVSSFLLTKDSEEYIAIQSLLEKGTWNKNEEGEQEVPIIYEIKAYENKFKRQVYELECEYMKFKNKTNHVNEIMAFHGSQKTNPEQIIVDGGVDMRYSKSNNYFGRAIYVTEDAAFVHRRKYVYSEKGHLQEKEEEKKEKELTNKKRKNTTTSSKLITFYKVFLLKVAVGNYMYSPEHKYNLIKPLPGYDSIYGPSSEKEIPMFVIYNNNQIQTNYVITYYYSDKKHKKKPKKE